MEVSENTGYFLQKAFWWMWSDRKHLFISINAGEVTAYPVIGFNTFFHHTLPSTCSNKWTKRQANKELDRQRRICPSGHHVASLCYIIICYFAYICTILHYIVLYYVYYRGQPWIRDICTLYSVCYNLIINLWYNFYNMKYLFWKYLK